MSEKNWKPKRGDQKGYQKVIFFDPKGRGNTRPKKNARAVKSLYYTRKKVVDLDRKGEKKGKGGWGGDTREKATDLRPASTLKETQKGK